MNKEILEHQRDCLTIRAKEIDNFMTKIINPEFINIRKKNEKMDEKINTLENESILHKERLKSMDKKIDEISVTLKDFIKEIRREMPSKKEVKENTIDINKLKDERFKFIIRLLICAMWLVWTLIWVIYSIKFK